MSFTKFIVSGAALAVAAGCTGGADHSEARSAASVEPLLVEGNPSCATYGLFSAKQDPTEANGEYTVTNGLFSASFTVDGEDKSIDWTSNLGVDKVIVKAGDNAYVYSYDPESMGDDDLISPNNNGGNQAAISHIDFCFDWELHVTKTAATTFDRDYGWSISKSAASTSLLLSVGQTYLLSYTVGVQSTGSTDSNWRVGGTISVLNPHPSLPAYIASVSDSFEGLGLAVDCPVSFPYTLPGGQTLTCTYQSNALAGPTGGTNTATASVTANSPVAGDSGTAAVTFSDAASTITSIDACVDVTDTMKGSLGEVCASNGPATFTYDIPFSYEACGQYSATNTASFSADSGETGSASVTVTADVPCVNGCTLTQVYWKTHSSFGPAPTDDAWAGKENTTFFFSGKTYYEVLWTAVAGNVYYSLAHQYIAAEMNLVNGASIPAGAQTAFDQATAIFANPANTPTYIGSLKPSNTLRQKMVQLAGTLGNYNEGAIGPGHCSE